MPGASLGRELLERLRGVNAHRAACATAHPDERAFRSEFESHHKLAVYGSLAPGQPNHRELAALAGRWTADLVTHGDRLDAGWGAGLGFPAIRWRLDAAPITVQLFHSEELERHWPRLDAFEGPEYRRILVPVFRAGVLLTVANLYEAAASGSAGGPGTAG
jgi:gamma-glutamylcyclotransferase (GGCT)/AIG2-like uncharacterized protein YtfP